nr:DUF2332 domain-containing protein [Pseudovibrio flavus]
MRNGYIRFAEYEAHGQSPTFEAWSMQVVGSPTLQAFLLSLPEHKRQPNLFFAAIRWVVGDVPAANNLPNIVENKGQEIAEVMFARSTQTNEPARCAVLLPLLASLPQPLALLEVGASAGLCLFPDRYAYDYDGTSVGLKEDGPVFQCSVSGAVPVPPELPEVVWRAGLDLNPLDIGSSDARDWLATLVWPEHAERRKRLLRAMDVVAQNPPLLVQGDVRDGLPNLLEQMPDGATPVVFHSAVLSYVADQVEREEFARDMLARDVVWISNESPRVFPSITDKVKGEPPRGKFLLSMNGEPKAWTGPHGQSIQWIDQTDGA